MSAQLTDAAEASRTGKGYFGSYGEARARIRELEAALAQASSVEHTKAHLARLARLLRSWWLLHGCGVAMDVRFHPTGELSTYLSCFLNGAAIRREKGIEPLTDDAWFQSWRDRGFEVHTAPGDARIMLRDTPSNRARMLQLLTVAFPNFKLRRTDTLTLTDGTQALRGLKVHFCDLEEVEALEHLFPEPLPIHSA